MAKRYTFYYFLFLCSRLHKNFSFLFFLSFSFLLLVHTYTHLDSYFWHIVIACVKKIDKKQSFEKN